MSALTPEMTRVRARRCVQWLLEVALALLISALVGIGVMLLVVEAGVRGSAVAYWAFGSWLASFNLLQVLNEVVLPCRTCGRTVGMLALRLRIVTLEGTVPSWKQFLVRYLLWIVDGLFWGLAGFVTMCCTPLRQRVGDLAARTVVVRTTVKSPDEPVLPGPDGELGAVAQPELPLGAGQVRLDGRQ